MTRLALYLCPFAFALAQQNIDLSYQLVIGEARQPAPDGAIWLYHYAWSDLDRLRLGDIRDGRVRLRLDASQLPARREALVLVVESLDRRWWRSPDLPPDAFLRDVPSAIAALGRTLPLPGGETLLVLPPASRRRITLQQENGRPVAGLRVPVSIYLFDRNHCGSHTGLPLGDFQPDASGVIVLTAPPFPLYLDQVHW